MREKPTNVTITHYNWCICWFFTRDFNFKRLTARRIYKSFGVKGLTGFIQEEVISADRVLGMDCSQKQYVFCTSEYSFVSKVKVLL
jgi:hypothetical protein